MKVKKPIGIGGEEGNSHISKKLMPTPSHLCANSQVRLRLFTTIFPLFAPVVRSQQTRTYIQRTVIQQCVNVWCEHAGGRFKPEDSAS